MTPLSTLQKRLHSLVAAGMKSNKRRTVAMLGLALSASLFATAGAWGGWRSSAPATIQLASIVPQGALLTIESKDFSSLLKQWNSSKEKAAWLKSDDYDAFSRSKLFGRLGDAQNEFARSAGLPPDMSFVQEVAGTDSIFAWYDVGKLEFLYITRMPSGDAEKSRLLALRGKFTRRQVGAMTFYVRSTGGESASDTPQGDATGADATDSGGQERTVAFATAGDWLLLATREDLMAGALTLLDRSTAATTASAKDTLLPLAAEPWFEDARKAAPPEFGDMRMTLNLEKIVRTPYFRSYWIQGNVSEMTQYRSAVADLSLRAGSKGGAIFREERVLLPASASGDAGATADLATMTTLLPRHAGVYRAIASPSVDATIGALDEKLLARAGGTYVDLRYAPVADVQVHPAGDSIDLETRIDATPLTRTAAASELAPLRDALAGADLQAMMTVSRTGAMNHEQDGNGSGNLWVPFQSAVVLSSNKDWDAARMQAALQHALAAHITTSDLGLAWKPIHGEAGTYLEISNTRPLELIVHGKLLVLSDDPDLMMEMMERMTSSTQERPANLTATADGAPGLVNAGVASQKGTPTVIAGFDTAGERKTFHRWTSLIDRNQGLPSSAGGSRAPGFFSGNMRSLGDVFSDLESERVVESRDGVFTRQTVTYAWRQ
jgi:hypothetical protein